MASWCSALTVTQPVAVKGMTVVVLTSCIDQEGGYLRGGIGSLGELIIEPASALAVNS